jgi:hypothetical protein
MRSAAECVFTTAELFWAQCRRSGGGGGAIFRNYWSHLYVETSEQPRKEERREYK